MESGTANVASAQSNTVQVQVNPAELSSLTIVSGTAQSAPVGQTFAPLTVRASDAFGNPIPGIAVAFSAPTSGASASLSATTVDTNATGEASVTATANQIGGSYAVTASSGNVQRTFTLTNVVPTSLALSLEMPNPPRVPGVMPGGNATYGLNIASTGTLPSPVQLSATGLPSGASAQFTSNNVVPPASSTLTISTSSATPLGIHAFSVIATSGTFTSSVSASLYVSSAIPGAGVISIDFGDPYTQVFPVDIAGDVPRPNWNVTLHNGGEVFGLFDETGTTTGAELKWDAYSTHTLPSPSNSADTRMMKGYLDTSDDWESFVSINGLPQNAGGYFVIVYADGDNTYSGANRTGRYRVTDEHGGDTSIDIQDLGNSDFSGQFLRALNGPGNCARFLIRGTAFELTATPHLSTDSYYRAPINGIQIIPADVLFANGFD